MEKDEVKEGDILVYKNKRVTKILFAGQHNGTRKIMDTEITKEYPDKTGWHYDSDFRFPTKEELEEYYKNNNINLETNYEIY